MVHCFSSNRISCQPFKSRSLQISISVDYNGDGSISKTSALVVYVRCKIYKGESPEQRQTDTQSTWGMFHPHTHSLSTELSIFFQSNPHSNRNHVSKLITTCLAMTNELLALCDYPVDDNKSTLSMSKDFPRLNRLGCSELIIPLQESLTVTLPPPSSVELTHQPFPLNTPTFKGLLIHMVYNSIIILTTLQNFMMKSKL